MVRKHVSGMHESAAPLAQEMKSSPDCTTYTDSDLAKLKRLQASARGHLARKTLEKQRIASGSANCAAAQASTNSTAVDETANVTKIQAAGLVPVKPAGPAPKYRPHLQPKPPPNPGKVLSEAALTKRAEKRLGLSVHRMLTNMPDWRPQDEFLLPFPAPVLLTSLSEEARRCMLSAERAEAEAWLKEATSQAESYQHRLKVESKLHHWHLQREAAKAAEAERKRCLEEEKEKAEKEQARMWKKKGKALQRKVAQWGAEKAEREERQEREKAAKKIEENKREAEKRERRQKRLKKNLSRWYAGETQLSTSDAP